MAKGLDGYASRRAEFLEGEWYGVRDPKVNWGAVISLTCDHLVESQICEKGLCNFFLSGPYSSVLWIHVSD